MAEPGPEYLEVCPHYDFSGGVKKTERISGCSTAVVLDPDVAEVFPDASAVSQTPRELLEARGEEAGNPSSPDRLALSAFFWTPNELAR